ncbi:MAG: hypothetical protein JRJ04_16990 [Deltaproteobacteria bacterium]|nr:hypothetical protein [Deltaproteobacteria bacterium]
MRRLFTFSVFLLAFALLFSSAAPVMAAEETVQIISPWQSSGRVFITGENELKFLGSFEGVMYIQNEARGTFDAAAFTCPVTIELDAKEGKTRILGNFIITSKTGDTVYAKLTADGVIGSSHGKFTITGGTGKLKGITGSGEIFIRTALGSLAVGMQSGAQLEALGLAIEQAHL